MKRTIIPYNSKVKPLAKKLRQRMTYSEVKLWNELKAGNMLGYDFDRQRLVGNYIIDFYCKDLQLAIEVDGITHHEPQTRLKDKFRQKELESLGINFLRFDALLVLNKVEAAVKEIGELIDAYEKENGVPLRVKAKRDRLQNPPRSS